MSHARREAQITWSAANTKSVGTGADETSDAQAIDAKFIRGQVVAKALHGGSPSSDDLVEIRVLYNLGDPDADPDSADEFDTPEHAIPYVLDLSQEDPALITIPIEYGNEFKIHTRNQAGESVTVSAQYVEQYLNE